MSMMPLISRCLGLSALVAALAVAGCATAGRKGVETLQLVGSPAVVFDAGGRPLFAGSQDFILAAAGNPGGVVHGATAEMVKISASGEPEMWLRCGDLRSPPRQCAASATAPTPPVMTRTLPICPGDPRCPRPKRK